MKRIRFQGREFVFVGDELAESGAIATQEAFEAGEVSYAHLAADGTVMRFGDSIGHRDEIEVLGQYDERPSKLRQFINCLSHPSWKRP